MREAAIRPKEEKKNDGKSERSQALWSVQKGELLGGPSVEEQGKKQQNLLIGSVSVAARLFSWLASSRRRETTSTGDRERFYPFWLSSLGSLSRTGYYGLPPYHNRVKMRGKSRKSQALFGNSGKCQTGTVSRSFLISSVTSPGRLRAPENWGMWIDLVSQVGRERKKLFFGIDEKMK